MEPSKEIIKLRKKRSSTYKPSPAYLAPLGSVDTLSVPNLWILSVENLMNVMQRQNHNEIRHGDQEIFLVLADQERTKELPLQPPG